MNNILQYFEEKRAEKEKAQSQTTPPSPSGEGGRGGEAAVCLVSLSVFPRTLRFKRPAGTSRGVYVERPVWYVALRTCIDGREAVGVGECAPLFDLSCDYTADYEETLRRLCRETERRGGIDYELLRPYPSILFGLETAFRSAVGSVRCCDKRRLFDSAFSEGRAGIPINGLVWMGTADEMRERMEEKLRQGFRCVKLKIGAIEFDEELALIRQLRAAFPADVVELRVDANGGFSPDEAMRRLEQLARYDIHSIEQPIRQGQWREMARLCKETPLPIALDEELIGVHDPVRKAALLDEIRPQYIILKPSLHGGFFGCDEWIDLARQRGVGFWATSALESNVGLNAIAQWAGEALESGRFEQRPQGLGTGQLFVENADEYPLHVEGDQLWYGDPKERAFSEEVENFKKRWADVSPTMTVQTSGSTGAPKQMTVEKERMAASARATIAVLGLQPSDTALLCMPLRYIAGQMVVVRALVGDLRLVHVAPTSHPYAALTTAPAFAALTPMQVYETLQNDFERTLLRLTRCVIIGGGAVTPEVGHELRSFPNAVWSTYGMTETLSHIALRRLSGPDASDAYRPLPGVEVSLSPEGTLCIYAPSVNPERLVTNDLAELLPDGAFRILGRRDNVICSGGIKMHIEELERRLASLPVPFQVTAVPDARLGEKVCLLYERAGAPSEEELAARCRALLDRHEQPRLFVAVDRLPLTATGKPARAEARRMAAEALVRSINE